MKLTNLKSQNIQPTQDQIEDVLQETLDHLHKQATANKMAYNASKSVGIGTTLAGAAACFGAPALGIPAAMLGGILYIAGLLGESATTDQTRLLPFCNIDLTGFAKALTQTGVPESEDVEFAAYLPKRDRILYLLILTQGERMVELLSKVPMKQWNPTIEALLSQTIRGLRKVGHDATYQTFISKGADILATEAQELGVEITAPPQGVPMPQAVEQPQIGPTTKLNSIDVPSVAVEPPSTAVDVQQSQPKKSELFDFNVLRTQPDEFTGFAIVADPGGGKTRLIKYLARNILTTGRMSVMDVYARNGDWQNAKLMVDHQSFLSEIKDDLDLIDSEIAAYRNGKNEFQPHLFVVEEAADTLSEVKNVERGSDKILSSWLSKYLTVTRKIGKRLCLVSVNIRDITDAIGSAEKRNSMVFIFPGAKGIAKAMTDAYIFKLGASENINLRSKLEKELRNVSRPALVYYRGQWCAAEIPEVNSDGSLVDGSSPSIEIPKVEPEAQPQAPTVEVQPQAPVASTPEQLQRMYELSPAMDHEVDEEIFETNSAVDEIRASFPEWNAKTLELAAFVVDWLRKKPTESFTAAKIRNERKLREDPKLSNEKLTKLLGLLADKGFVVESENKFAALIEDDYDF